MADLVAIEFSFLCNFLSICLWCCLFVLPRVPFTVPLFTFSSVSMLSVVSLSPFSSLSLLYVLSLFIFCYLSPLLSSLPLFFLDTPFHLFSFFLLLDSRKRCLMHSCRRETHSTEKRRQSHFDWSEWWHFRVESRARRR